MISKHLENREKAVEISSHSKNLAQGVFLGEGQEIFVAWVLGECLGQGFFLNSSK